MGRSSLSPRRAPGQFFFREDEVVVSKLSHGLLAEDELDDVKAVDALGAEHSGDVGRPRVALLAPAHLRRALLEHERLEHVEVLVDRREGLRDLAKGPARGGAGVVLATHAVVIPGEYFLLEAGQVRGLLLGGERHGDGSGGGRKGAAANTKKRSRILASPGPTPSATDAGGCSTRKRAIGRYPAWRPHDSSSHCLSAPSALLSAVVRWGNKIAFDGVCALF